LCQGISGNTCCVSHWGRRRCIPAVISTVCFNFSPWFIIHQTVCNVPVLVIAAASAFGFALLLPMRVGHLDLPGTGLADALASRDENRIPPLPRQYFNQSLPLRLRLSKLIISVRAGALLNC